MTSISSRSSVDHAATAAEAVRTLIHLTHDRGALGGPAELDRLVAELAVMTGQLPQLLRQLRDWLDAEQHAGRPRPDNTTDPAQIVDRATNKLAQAGRVADDLGSALDDAHQLLAHLAATEPDHTHQPGQSDAPPAPPLATAGQKPWPSASTFMATSGQVLWPPAGRNQCPLTLVREHHRVVEMSDPRVWRNPR